MKQENTRFKRSPDGQYDVCWCRGQWRGSMSIAPITLNLARAVALRLIEAHGATEAIAVPFLVDNDGGSDKV